MQTQPLTVTSAPVRAARRLRRRRERAATGRMLVEGPRAVDEAIGNLTEVFVGASLSQRAQETIARCRAQGVPVRPADERALAALADAQTPQGIVGVATRPRATLAATASATLLIVLDGIADPGNLGTIVRTADAAGADAVVLTVGSVDPTNAKAVRASAGSLFHLPVIDGISPDALAAHCRAAGITLVAAAADGAIDYRDVTWRAPTAIVFGNEAHGVSTAMAAHVSSMLAVPIRHPEREGYRGHAESLNLATTVAVVAFEIARQRDARA